MVNNAASGIESLTLRTIYVLMYRGSVKVKYFIILGRLHHVCIIVQCQ